MLEDKDAFPISGGFLDTLGSSQSNKNRTIRK